MPSAFDYREMAHDCLQEADRTTDAERKGVLMGLAKLYTQTALAMDGAAKPGAAPLVGSMSEWLN